MDRNEIYKYLRLEKSASDEKTERLIDECIEEYEREISPCSIYRVFPCVRENSEIKAGEIVLKGNSIKQALDGCSHAIVFAATLTQKADLMVKRALIKDMAKAAVLQAVFSQGIEEYINEKEREIAKAENVKQMNPRFSPGYGDFPLETQKDIFDRLEITKRIGISLTDEFLMIPTKSVTAIIGITKEVENEV